MRVIKSLFTLCNDKASQHKHQQQGKGSKCVRNDLSSSNCSNETEEGESHLMHPNEGQELFEKPEKMCIAYLESIKIQTAISQFSFFNFLVRYSLAIYLTGEGANPMV